MEISESLREIRESRGITPCALAKQLHTNHQNIYRWESGQVLPSIEMCIKLADFYGVTLDELVGRKLN